MSISTGSVGLSRFQASQLSESLLGSLDGLCFIQVARLLCFFPVEGGHSLGQGITSLSPAQGLLKAFLPSEAS